jgi:hypothetical protein
LASAASGRIPPPRETAAARVQKIIGHQGAGSHDSAVDRGPGCRAAAR